MKKIDAHAHLGYIGGWANVKNGCRRINFVNGYI